MNILNGMIAERIPYSRNILMWCPRCKSKSSVVSMEVASWLFCSSQDCREAHMERRIRRFTASGELIIMALMGRCRPRDVIENSIPETAKIINAQWKWPGNVEFLVDDESFDPVEEGHEIPEILPVMRELTWEEQYGRLVTSAFGLPKDVLGCHAGIKPLVLSPKENSENA